MSSLDDILSAAQRVEQAWTAAALTDSDAVGVALDNPDDPQVAVTVHGGRIVYIGISDPMARGDLRELQDVLNACIFNAFAQWNSKRGAAA